MTSIVNPPTLTDPRDAPAGYLGRGVRTWPLPWSVRMTLDLDGRRYDVIDAEGKVIAANVGRENAERLVAVGNGAVNHA